MSPKKISLIIGIALFLVGYYQLIYGVFYKHSLPDEKNEIPVENQYPVLRARLGTILSHSSDYGGQEHLYCYYPHTSSLYDNKSGEYILKRADKIENCQDWYGMVIFNEGWWVSEKEKIWWRS